MNSDIFNDNGLAFWHTLFVHSCMFGANLKKAEDACNLSTSVAREKGISGVGYTLGLLEILNQANIAIYSNNPL